MIIYFITCASHGLKDFDIITDLKIYKNVTDEDCNNKAWGKSC